MTGDGGQEMEEVEEVEGVRMNMHHRSGGQFPC